MPAAFFHHMFSQHAQDLQLRDGSRDVYARMQTRGRGERDWLTQKELGFIALRDSFYIATVTPEGWPYVQHRGGSPGFLVATGQNQLAFADFAGNRQHITAGNLTGNPRLAMFCMDYPSRRRLKLIGTGRVIERSADPALFDRLPTVDLEPARRAILVDVWGFDWNCPKYILPRMAPAQIGEQLHLLERENASLRQRIEQLEGNTE